MNLVPIFFDSYFRGKVKSRIRLKPLQELPLREQPL